MKQISKYARKVLSLRGHGHMFCSVMHFPMFHSVLSSKNGSYDDYDGEEQE